MRFGSEDLRGVLTGSFDVHWTADLYYNGDRRLTNLPITDPTFGEDANANIQQSGALTVEWSDEFATSLLPRYINDPLAPFGAQLHIHTVIEAPPFSERVQYGWFEITNVPSAVDRHGQFDGRTIVLGSHVELEVKELLAGPARETFDAPTAPASLTSTWDEIARITGLPISRTVDDAAITRSIMYPEGVLDAVYDLADVMLDAVPHMTADGALAARPNVWPDPVDELTMAGALVKVGAEMSSDQVYNRVVVRTVSGEQTRILAVAEVTSGPLRVRNTDGTRSPFGARTRYLSSEFVTTTTQAVAWAGRELAKVSTLRTRVVPVTEKLNPLRERGDVVLIERPTEWLLARVVTISRSGRTQNLTAEVAETIPI